MKLRPLYEQILVEIGETYKVPPGASFKVGEHGGLVKFNFSENEYILDIRLPIKQSNKIAMAADFGTNEIGDSLTNKHLALQVISYIAGCIEEWLNRYKEKYYSNSQVELVYILFNPKSETDELGKADSSGANKRDRVYRMYIEKFAKKLGSTVTWVTSGPIIAKFNPSIIIK